MHQSCAISIQFQGKRCAVEFHCDFVPKSLLLHLPAGNEPGGKQSRLNGAFVNEPFGLATSAVLTRRTVPALIVPAARLPICKASSSVRAGQRLMQREMWEWSGSHDLLSFASRPCTPTVEQAPPSPAVT